MRVLYSILSVCAAVERRYIELFLHSDPTISAGGYSSFEGLFSCADENCFTEFTCNCSNCMV